MTILPPVRPWRGRRGTDHAGSGVFGASRGGRLHAGLDLIAQVGDEVVSPIGGIVTHIGKAYPDANLGSIHIKGAGQHAWATIKLLYVAPERLSNESFRTAKGRNGLAPSKRHNVYDAIGLGLFGVGR